MQTLLFIPSLLSGDMHTFCVKVGAVVFLWLLVIGASLIDLITGIQASKRTGNVKTTSWGIRKTLNKDLQYLAMLVMMLLIDVALSSLSEHFTIFSIPICSFICTAAITIIEALSVCENLRKGRNKEEDKIDDIQLLLSNTIDLLGTDKVKQLLTAMQKQVYESKK